MLTTTTAHSPLEYKLQALLPVHNGGKLSKLLHTSPTHSTQFE